MDIKLVRDNFQLGWQQLRYVTDPDELAEALVTKLGHELGTFIATFMRAHVTAAYHSGGNVHLQNADRRDALYELRNGAADVVGLLALALKMLGDDKPYLSITNAAATRRSEYGEYEGLAFVTGRLAEFAATAEQGVVPMPGMPKPVKPG